MVKALIFAVLVAQASTLAQSVPRRPVMLPDLTVPLERLPAGCALSPAPLAHLDGQPWRMGLWASLPIPANPWVGIDKPLIASIRERMEGPMLMPGGPPPSAREFTRERLHFADGVDEAYAAIYLDSESNLTVVYASRFSADNAADIRSSAPASNNPRLIRVALGLMGVVVSGDGGACFRAGAYVMSLAN
jgi:hypothetical protein